MKIRKIPGSRTREGYRHRKLLDEDLGRRRTRKEISEMRRATKEFYYL